MKIVSMGNGQIVEGKPETPQAIRYDEIDGSYAPVASTESIKTETQADQNDTKTSQFARIYDLIQEAEKRKKMRLGSKDTKIKRMIKAYLSVRNAELEVSTKGGAYGTSV